jgi:hypothetical protein
MSQFLGNTSHPNHINLFILGEVQDVFQVRRRRKGRTEDFILLFRERERASHQLPLAGFLGHLQGPLEYRAFQTFCGRTLLMSCCYW